MYILYEIVRSLDIEKRELTSQSVGLAAIADGLSIISNDDYDNIIKKFPVYDVLYAFAKADNKDKLLTSRH